MAINTVARRQPALRFRDQWLRGATYTRRFTVRDCDGVAVDLSEWPELIADVEGEDGSRGTGAYIFVRFDEENGGAAAGRLYVVILDDGLELDRDGNRGAITYSIKGRRNFVEDLPLAHVKVLVKESAFR